VRPTVSELYALKHSDVGFSEEPEALLLHIRKGKTPEEEPWCDGSVGVSR